MPFYPGSADYRDGFITVSDALVNPTSIEQRIAEVASKNLLVDTLFTTGGEVSGGAVIYSSITEKHLFTTDVADRQPGDEYKVVYSERPEAQLAKVQDFGGKFAVSDEAKRRNQSVDFDNDVTMLSNTIVRKLNARAIETLEAGTKAPNAGKSIGAVGAEWDKLILDGDPAKITAPQMRPTAHFAIAQSMADDLEMGIRYSKLLVNPLDHASLKIAYADRLTDVLDAFELELISSVHVPAGTAYLVDPGKVGFVRYEEPLTVTTFRDEHHRQTWVQAYCMPVMGVTNPNAVCTIKGINASILTPA